MLNGFRLTGDILHLLGLLLLPLIILKYKSCAGISGQSQMLYALVFTCRYSDLFTFYLSVYNTLFKVLYLSLTYLAVFLICYWFRKTYQSKLDSFWAWFLVFAAAVLAYFFNYAPNFFEYFWTFSIYLEAVTMWPQFYQTARIGKINCYMSLYLAVLALYRGFYIINWVYRYQVENHFDPISSVSGGLQFLSYIVFLGYALFKGIKVTSKAAGDSTKHYEGNLYIIPLTDESLQQQKKYQLLHEESTSQALPTVSVEKH